MGEKLIKPYEISVWEEKLTQIEGSEPAKYKFKEVKLAVIGSDTMTGLNKVYEPVFTKKTNGEKILTFSLKYKYFDPYSENEDVVNPFAALLVNERKVKLHYDGEWYEFIIKDHTESSDGLTWTYTCTDAFILELSKNGYNIEFSTDLNNNQGTAPELAEKTLENTDWRVGKSDVLQQLIAEPIYKAVLKATSGVNIINTDDGSAALSGQTDVDIYLFYTYIKNKNGKFVQFIIRDENKEYTIDSNNIITDTNYRITTELTYKDDGFYLNNTRIILFNEIETQFQANRLAYAQKNTYDPIMEHTVDIFQVGEDEREVYKYTDYTYTTSNVVMNYMANGDNFNALEDGSLQGWNPYVDSSNNDAIQKLELVTYPELKKGKPLADLETLSQIQGYLKVNFIGAITNDYRNMIFNDGIQGNTSFINSISQGDEFVFRWRAGHGEIQSLQPVDTLGLVVARYTRDAPQRWGRYYYHPDPSDIILDIKGTPTELNNIIEGGEIRNTEDGQIYVIDGVAQSVSTKYLYKSGSKLYYWDGVNSQFKEKGDSYIPYYYLTGKALKAVPNAVLTDSTVKYGIFIYTTIQNSPIYIQDIQLTRCVRDANGNIVTIGNIPTATIDPVEYYYLKPSDGTAAEDVQTYTSIDELASNLGVRVTDIKPIYNENSEKYLSISVSQSNCFNILQTIAETFECWVDIVVNHDDTGAITYDKDGRPEKYVYLREYVGTDNWAGFKYGINLNSIERNINSDEIVTKLIVDNSQSEYVDEGFISIANAPSNPSGEQYILNFDYYYSQGLLDRKEAEKDRQTLTENVSQINIELRELEQKRIKLEASLTDLGSKRNIYTELIDSAEDMQTQALEDFEYLTEESYEEYRGIQVDVNTVRYEDSFYVLTTDTELDSDKNYYTYNKTTKVVTLVESPNVSAINTYYELLDDLLDEENIAEVLGRLYTSSATINNYSGILSNISTEYWNVRKELRGSENYTVTVWTVEDELHDTHLYVELSDYLVGFKFYLGSNIQDTYESTVSKKYFNITTNNETTITFIAPTGYTMETTTYTFSSNPKTFKITATEHVDGIEDQIDDLIEEKKQYVNEFNNKYSRFIAEGTWNSTDYIDSELYYLDALQVSNTSAQPVVSYTINVVEVSRLEGLEDYSFNVGDKTYVEDTEFFGWASKGKDGILTPAREEVIVSEVEWHLDEPENNVITVQNYKTRFEDLFQRISAAVQTVQYNEATYAKMSSLMDANGTINQDVLVRSLQQIAGKEYNLTSDGSIQIDGDRILVTNLNNTQNLVIINSEGIRISSNGGSTWATAIDGRGINIGAVYTGKLNTDQVIIGNETNPSFRWDKSGISAYKSIDGEAYDLKTFVRYDQYGLYGIKSNGAFKASSLEEVKNNAHFAVTWDGFFIRNNYEGGGRVEITSGNDFRVLNTVNGQENEKIKIGALEWMVKADAESFSSNNTYYVKNENGYEVVEEPNISEVNTYYEKKFEPQPGIEPSLYGIRIKNNAGEDVMKTDDDGNLILTGAIEALEGNFGKLITVGKNDETVSNWIIIDGEKSIIQTSDYHDGASNGWMINSTGDAVFNNITARGAIKTAVFEYAEIQAVGGVFIFRPSSTIKSARLGDESLGENPNDLIVKVEKPLLFEKVSYNKISDPTGNPQEQATQWYERASYGGYKPTTDTSVDSTKEYFIKVETSNGSWCKISNYTSDGADPDSTLQNILRTNGLTHVYKVLNINSLTGEITLEGAKTFVTAVKQDQTTNEFLASLAGGALIDMGRQDGSSNYGIGVNSSDNTVNLPARAISLFETVVNPTNNLKVTYNIRGILGTLPRLEYTGDKPKVNEIYHNNLEGTQGIYTDNMYIGNHDQYITFYSSKEDGSKHLKINAQEFTLKAGAFNGRAIDGRQNFVYLSNEDYAKDIVNGIQINNSNIKADWRLIIGNKFGVDKAGNLYASNAHIEGDIQATSGHFGSISYDGNTTTIPENAVTGLTDKLNQISNEASLKGYTLHVESIYPDYPSEIIDGTPDNITLIAHVYYANRDITTSCDPNLFIWQLKNEEQIETLTPNIDNPYSVTYDRNLAGYGTTIICNFAIDEEVLLTTPDHFALETPDGYLLTARV